MNIYHKNDEVWKQIPHLPDYEASNYGDIRNRKTGTIRKPQVCKKYYARVNIGRHNHLVHRLVMSAFIGRSLIPSEMVLHRDDDGLNNRISNLTIGTALDNWADRKRNDRAGYKLRLRDVSRIRFDLRRRNWHDIAREHGISHSHVRNIATRKCYGWFV